MPFIPRCSRSASSGPRTLKLAPIRRSDLRLCGSDGARQGYPPPSALRGLDPRHALPELALIGALAKSASYAFARSAATFQGWMFYAGCNHVVILHGRMTTSWQLAGSRRSTHPAMVSATLCRRNEHGRPPVHAEAARAAETIWGCAGDRVHYAARRLVRKHPSHRCPTALAVHQRALASSGHRSAPRGE